MKTVTDMEEFLNWRWEIEMAWHQFEHAATVDKCNEFEKLAIDLQEKYDYVKLPNGFECEADDEVLSDDLSEPFEVLVNWHDNDPTSEETKKKYKVGMLVMMKTIMEEEDFNNGF